MMTEANLKEIIKTYISKDENHILPITTNDKMTWIVDLSAKSFLDNEKGV